MITDYGQIELDRAKEIVGQLLDEHWPGILRAVENSEDGEGSASIAIKLDHSGTSRLVKAKLSYAVRTTGEAEYIVRDPNQQEMKL